MKKKNKNLEKLRIEKGYSIRDIAKIINISSSYYCQLENGDRRLYYDLAIKIAKVFDLKPDDIFFNELK